MELTEERLKQTFSEGGAQESMKLAFRMCKFYPELMDELKRILEAMEISYYKPAVKCVRNRILIGKLR